MRQFQSPYDIANTIRMARSLHLGAFLLVEGSTDARVYERFAPAALCRVISAQDKDTAIAALGILDAARFPGVLAIVDADFWHIDSVARPSQNVVTTDNHDLEMMILKSPALERLLAEFGSKSEIPRIGKPVRTLLLEASLDLGVLRWLSGSTQEKWGLTFRGLPLESYIDPRTLGVDTPKLVDAVITRSKKANLQVDDILRKITAAKAQVLDPWEVCCGHDAVRVLGVGLNRLFGNHRGNSLGYDQLDAILRLSFDFEHFRQTGLYAAIRQWESNNPSYIILP